MKILGKVALLLAIAGSATAGDLVMKLGTVSVPQYHRIAVSGSVTISPATGDIIIDPVQETGIGGDGWCPTTGAPGAPSFTTAFSASPASLLAGGGTVTLSWTVSNATSCTASASPSVSGWSGSVSNTSGSVQVNLTASGTYNFSLSCTGAGGTTAAPVRQVTVASVLPPPTACTNRPPPTGIVRQESMVNNPRFPENNEFPFNAGIDLQSYSPILGTFPAAGQTAYVFIDTGKYIAMQFSTAGVANGVFGEISWEQPATNAGLLWVMISECPGDFDWVTNGNCKLQSGASAMTWWVGSGAPSWVCPLDQNKTYYVNAIYANTSNWTSTTCRESGGGILSNCHWFITDAGRANLSGSGAASR